MTDQEKKQKQKLKEAEKVAKEKEKEKARKEKEKEKARKEKEKEKQKVAKEKEKVRLQKEKEKEAKKNIQPVMVEQLNEKGEIELVDKNRFPFEIECEDCGSIRYVNQAGLLQTKKCKRCAKKARRSRLSASRRGRAKLYKAVVEDALAQGLFPEDFKAKYNLQ